MSTPKAIFFDVDFTLIYPGPAFDGEGYRSFAERHGIVVDPARFHEAVANASAELDAAQDQIYRPELFVRYARRVIEEMGGGGVGLHACAWEIYEQWAACQHFALYEDVVSVMRALHRARMRIGLISNTHRCLTSFQSHFELEPFITAAISSSQHGYMKPHPSIFQAALRLIGVEPGEAVMVGDSLTQDVDGARGVGMRAVLLVRSGGPSAVNSDVPVIETLMELLPLLGLT